MRGLVKGLAEAGRAALAALVAAALCAGGAHAAPIGLACSWSATFKPQSVYECYQDDPCQASFTEYFVFHPDTKTMFWQNSDAPVAISKLDEANIVMTIDYPIFMIKDKIGLVSKLVGPEKVTFSINRLSGDFQVTLPGAPDVIAAGDKCVPQNWVAPN